MPAKPAQLELEAQARAACEAGDFDNGMAYLVEAYGPELLRFLCARLGDADAASDVYSEVAERLWKSLPRFEWRHGARGYCYAIARNCAISFATAASRRPERNLSLSAAVGASAAVERVRTATRPFLKTEVKDRFRALREQLTPEDQTLLALRLDRGLDWRELALVMTYEGNAPSEASLTREASRLRQRFKSAKDKLRRYAEREGLLQ